ncbi:hypothetical protein JW988_00555 [Candidatus Bathyarchaeota archaeon]|nr:hypothetical protein [Candidatus Bathyarchaeota archaeon]
MKKIILPTGLSILLLLAMAVPALAQKELVGVQVGDWFKYKAEVTQWESTMEFLPDNYLGPLILAENQTDAIWYNVTDITSGDGGDNVTFAIQYDWTNGTVTYATMVENVSTANQMIFIIGANMTSGEMVSDTYDFLNMNIFQYPARYINETIDFANPNATRETNVLEYDINILGAPYEYIFYWDKATGMRVWYWNHGDVPEIDFGTGTPQPAYEYTVVWELVDSSVEDLLVPDFTGPILLLTLMTITAPKVFLHRRKKLIT